MRRRILAAPYLKSRGRIEFMGEPAELDADQLMEQYMGVAQ